jgi:hypothetical protein
MEDLLSYNEGLPSRFPSQFTFDDYQDDELLAIFQVGLPLHNLKPGNLHAFAEYLLGVSVVVFTVNGGTCIALFWHP